MDQDDYMSFIAASSERIRKVLPRGYSEEVDFYDCDGAGKPYAEYILGNFYRENLNEAETKELAVYTIVGTSKIDPSVGEDIDLLVFPAKETCRDHYPPNRKLLLGRGRRNSFSDFVLLIM